MSVCDFYGIFTIRVEEGKPSTKKKRQHQKQQQQNYTKFIRYTSVQDVLNIINGQ